MTTDHRLGTSVDIAWESARFSGSVATVVSESPSVLPASEPPTSAPMKPRVEPQAEPRPRQVRLGTLTDEVGAGRRRVSGRPPWYRGLWARVAGFLQEAREGVRERPGDHPDVQALRHLFDAGVHHVR